MEKVEALKYRLTKNEREYTNTMNWVREKVKEGESGGIGRKDGLDEWSGL